ncbi:MAG: hypothetical protein EOO38_16735 [Cytophagaceae bacterium]|nr:MAG: hypothetical protein EOO38_16735 [Cytophagaceae bacterium]
MQTNGVGPINASSAVMRLGDERTDRTAKFSPVLTYRDLEFGRKSMVFLIQGADPSSVRAAVDAHMRVRGATVVVLCWKLPCDELRSEYRDVHVLFGANSTWTQGRNALFWYALQLEATENEGPFEFVTLLDEDAILHCSQTTESCVQQFAEYARKKKAAVVVPAYFRSCWYNDTENIVRDFDALYNTFHRLAVGLLLPYHENYDSISWHRSQQIVIHQSSCFLGHVYEFAGVRVQSMLHREYPKGSVCTRESVTQDIVPSSVHPLVSWTCKECIPRETLSRIVNSTRTKHNDELRWVESICNATALLGL